MKILFKLVILTLILSSCTKEKALKLPLTFHNGYGPFESSLRAIYPYSDNENDPWKKTHLKTSGIPKNWTDVKIGDIDTDTYQSMYQNYYLGNITKEKYDEFQKSGNWVPDPLSLSKEPIKCKIAFAYGKDSNGELKVIVDANNNLDFSDDTSFTPLKIGAEDKIDEDSLLKNSSVTVNFERFSNNKITEVSTPLSIVYLSQYNTFMCNFAQYAKTKLNNEEVVIYSNGFTDLSYNKLGIVKVSKLTDNEEKVNPREVIAKNEYIEIENSIYKNLGVKMNENVLVLEKMNLPKNELSSTQIGFKAFDFSGNDFKTKTPISLDNLKGKHVYLDFWATWCGPCIEEIPNLKDLYNNIDSSKFEIISVVGASPLEDLEEMIQKHSISWSQIVSDDVNKIKEKYGVSAYPTTFLLNPEGVIIAKNIRGVELNEKINSIILK